MRPTKRALALAVAALALPAPAGATEASPERVRSLAERALVDPRALSDLRDVDRVDGHPADLDAALEGARGDELETRLRELASAPAAPPTRRGREPRAEAADILSERRFEPPPFPRPFKGVLERLAEWTEPVRDWVAGLIRWVPGGEVTVWSVLAAVMLVLVALATLRTLRGRARLALEDDAAGAGPRSVSPAALERDAARAEREGRLEDAVRLRFRAGLVRLDRENLIDFRDSLPTGEVSRRLRSNAFDDLASDFDAIVYGGRPAGPRDVDAARIGWRRVLEEAR